MPTPTPTRSYTRRPKALREARKIAESARVGRSPARVSYENIWLQGTGTHTFGYENAESEFQVRYIMPRVSGFFICNETLWLTDEEWAEYEAFEEQQEA
ncbi:hypothetical protein EDF62_3083 [Leucobacter luti]|uniref:Uncharacterized protein n=1 Tax=Leucobacter luti TaxID=340320 RepID=A0A4R6RUP3_9MICO|nr:hypothetical protein [Leucobacter luti]TDP89786.1 hypothetical protein EDF62_3083 [Leucobacter luti]